jgi:hypothetical protein
MRWLLLFFSLIVSALACHPSPPAEHAQQPQLDCSCQTLCPCSGVEPPPDVEQRWRDHAQACAARGVVCQCPNCLAP